METKHDIKTKFCSLRNETDLLNLLNEAKKNVFGIKNFPFTIQQLKYHAFASYNKNNRYQSFEIPKKTGGKRTITAPNVGLKAIQKVLNFILQQVYEPHSAANGFVPSRSIVDNARVHIGQNYVYNIDLKDFFPSIEQPRIFVRLQKKPFNLPKPIAGIIANLCCHNMEVERLDENGNIIKMMKNVLPQGAPTSPTLTNIICERLDKQLSNLANNYNLKYSRYADDLTFSSMHNVYQNNSEFIVSLHKIIAEQHFLINEKKTRLQNRNRRQEVTGLIVSDRINVFKKYIKGLRLWLHIWETLGQDTAQAEFAAKYNASKCHHKGTPHIENVLSGKLQYLQMVKGANDPTYKKLNERYNLLFNNKNLSPIISVLEKTDNKVPSEKKHEQIEANIANNVIAFTNSNERIKNHSPQTMISFLYQFSINEKFKWFTHCPDKDMKFDYSTYILTAQNDFEKITGWHINDRTYYNVKNFIIKGTDRCKIDDKTPIECDWLDTRVKEWCEKNKNTHPYEAPIADKFFSNYIDQFKQLIEYRTDDKYQTFYSRTKKEIKNCFGVDINVSFTNDFCEIGKSLKTYCDVRLMNNALKQIAQWIENNKSKSPNVEISLIEESSNYTLTIFHKDSYISLDPDDNKLQGLSGDFHEVRKCLFCVADFEILATFKHHQQNENYRIICLDSKTKLKNKQLTPIPPNDKTKTDDTINGVKYLLKLYKNITI